MNIKKYINTINKFGFQYFLSLSVNFLLTKIGILDRLELIKFKIRSNAAESHVAEVLAGEFKGMLLSANTWWGKNDYITKLLGQYEIQVMIELAKLSKNYEHFIDIGAGDGYFVVGALKSNLFKTASSFEIEKLGKNNF